MIYFLFLFVWILYVIYFFHLLKKLYHHLALIIISSILRIILTHSVAKVRALYVTNIGWTTFSTVISSTMKFFFVFYCKYFWFIFLKKYTFFILIPALFYPFWCLFLNSVTTTIGFRPAFSARVNGITSSASPNALTHIDSVPFN